MKMSRLTRDETIESVSRDQIFKRERGQGNIQALPGWSILLLYVMTHTDIHTGLRGVQMYLYALLLLLPKGCAARRKRPNLYFRLRITSTGTSVARQHCCESSITYVCHHIKLRSQELCYIRHHRSSALRVPIEETCYSVKHLNTMS